MFLLNSRGLMMFSKLLASAALAAAMMAAPAAFAHNHEGHAHGAPQQPAAPKRVAVFDLAALDILNALEVDAIVALPKGTSETGNFPAYLSAYSDAQYVSGGTLFEPNLEALANIKPDLVVLGGRSRNKEEAVKAIAPVLQMNAVEGATWESAKANTLAFGKLFHKTELAEKKVAELDAALAALQAAGSKAGTGMFLFATAKGASVQGPGARFGHAYEFTGLKSVVPAETESAGPRPAAGSPEAAQAKKVQAERLEQAIGANPNWIIVLDRAAATAAPEKTIQERLASMPTIANSEAFKAGRVIYLDPTIWYIVGSGIDGLIQSAKSVRRTLDGSK
jgi:iron complex transport system substrate-binding protein